MDGFRASKRGSGGGSPRPPGKRGLPIIGETIEFLRDPTAFTTSRHDRFGSIFHTHILGKPTVFMRGAAANHWIYAGDGKYLRNEWSPAIQRLLGQTSMAMIDGDEHKARRKLLAPHFKRTVMGECVPPMLRVARKHLRRWQTDSELGPIAIVPRMRALAFEITATYVLGEFSDLGVELDAFSRDFETTTNGMFVVAPVALPGTAFARAVAARERMFTVLDDLVRRRDAEERSSPDVLSTLLRVRDDQGRPLPRSTIVDELHLLLFAGHDTTVVATSNAVFHLAQHPEVAAKARAEQDAMDTRAYTLESLRAMPYLEAIIKESMRLIPPIGGSFRVMTRDEEYGGFTIPEGWRIAIGPRSVHHDPELYPQPDRFRPERWLDAAENDARPPFSWIPFGGGPRTCLGMHFAMLEMHMVLAMLLRGHEWELSPGQDLGHHNLPFPLPKGGAIVELRPRDAKAKA